MRVRLWYAPLCLVALLAAAPGWADPSGRYFTLSPFGGYTLFDGNLRFPRTAPVQDGADVGARLGYQWSPWLGFELAGGFTPTHEDSGGADVKYTHGSANVVVSPAPALWGGPFVFAGLGAARMSSNVPAAQVSNPYSLHDPDLTTGNLEWGGGLKVWLTDVLAVRIEGRVLHWLPKESNGLRLNHIIVGLGVTYALGARPRDTDRDGVADRFDTCPATPLGAKVDAHGCPIDSDGDGVYDGLDQCPNTPKGAVVDAKGCPIDSDGDGVPDGIDQCPNTPRGAVVDAKGCPVDSDGDGVPDGIDQCPNTPKGAVVDANGCPVDSDGDGVPDGIDQCPNTPAGLKVDDKGCPVEVIEKETELLDTGMIRLENIHFDTDRWDVLPADTLRLTEVGAVLKNWPQLKIEIGGHTDSRGSAKHNDVLSQKRAASVRDYLLHRFPDLKADAFTTRGYGPERPIVPNTTAANMARNRRVEFVVLNRDVLRKEIEHRRTLKQGEPAPPATPPGGAATPAPAPGAPGGTIAPSPAPTPAPATPAPAPAPSITPSPAVPVPAPTPAPPDTTKP